MVPTFRFFQNLWDEEPSYFNPWTMLFKDNTPRAVLSVLARSGGWIKASSVRVLYAKNTRIKNSTQTWEGWPLHLTVFIRAVPLQSLGGPQGSDLKQFWPHHGLFRVTAISSGRQWLKGKEPERPSESDHILTLDLGMHGSCCFARNGLILFAWVLGSAANEVCICVRGRTVGKGWLGFERQSAEKTKTDRQTEGWNRWPRKKPQLSFFKKCGPFLKSLLNFLQYCFCCFMPWFSGHKAYGILASRPGVKPPSPALEDKVLTTGPPGKSQFC